MHDKITQQHLDRGAFIYVRQSTYRQVTRHHQGRQRQYDLADSARQLGFREVTVIDDDQGKTGSGMVVAVHGFPAHGSAWAGNSLQGKSRRRRLLSRGSLCGAA